MADIRWSLSEEDIEWTMDWKDKPSEQRFEDEAALAHLLINDVIFLNSHHWEDTWPKAAQEVTSLNVNCNDIFAWGCADAEELPYAEIENLYRMWRKDPSWGSAIWCLIRRKELPQRPVEKYIRKAGIWDLDSLKAEHGLRANHYDGMGGVLARRKYATYAGWAGKKARPYDAQWWDGWKEYVAAHPDWNSTEWQAEDDRLVAEFRSMNGFS